MDRASNQYSKQKLDCHLDAATGSRGCLYSVFFASTMTSCGVSWPFQ